MPPTPVEQHQHDVQIEGQIQQESHAGRLSSTSKVSDILTAREYTRAANGMNAHITSERRVGVIVLEVGASLCARFLCLADVERPEKHGYLYPERLFRHWDSRTH